MGSAGFYKHVAPSGAKACPTIGQAETSLHILKINQPRFFRTSVDYVIGTRLLHHLTRQHCTAQTWNRGTDLYDLVRVFSDPESGAIGFVLSGD